MVLTPATRPEAEAAGAGSPMTSRAGGHQPGSVDGLLLGREQEAGGGGAAATHEQEARPPGWGPRPRELPEGVGGVIWREAHRELERLAALDLGFARRDVKRRQRAVVGVADAERHEGTAAQTRLYSR